MAAWLTPITSTPPSPAISLVPIVIESVGGTPRARGAVLGRPWLGLNGQSEVAGTALSGRLSRASSRLSAGSGGESAERGIVMVPSGFLVTAYAGLALKVPSAIHHHGGDARDSYRRAGARQSADASSAANSADEKRGERAAEASRRVRAHPPRDRASARPGRAPVVRQTSCSSEPPGGDESRMAAAVP